MKYEDYIRSKMATSPPAGFAVEDADMNPALFPFQRDIVRWAARRGRAAIFADCGMGKTLMQLEWARLVAERTSLPVLILCPLAVAEQTVDEAKRFGIDAAVSRDGTVAAPIVVTNYEQRDKFDIAEFAGLVIDESSILKSYSGKVRTDILRLAAMSRYRLACTATPAPNDHVELGNHAQFVGVMNRDEMLSTFFTRDNGDATDGYRLKGHARKAFWEWVATWAVCVRMPSDIGHSDDGFVLPELHVETQIVDVDRSGDADEGELFRRNARSLGELRRESKRTLPVRVSMVAAQVQSASAEPWIIWCHTNAEEDALCAAIPEAVAVRGSDKPDTKATRMLGFARGEFRVLVTKPSIAGFGMNWQHCARVAFVGLTHSYEQFYQALRRCWRFGQSRAVEVYIPVPATEEAVLKSIQEKEAAALEMAREMSAAMRQTSLEGTEGASMMRDEYESTVARGPGYEFHLGDSVERLRDVESDSVGFSVFSPPFASLFTYSNSARDLGNCTSQSEFLDHFGFIVDELYRVMMPGRLVAFHCQQIVTTIVHDGVAGLRDFRGDLIRLFQARGFNFHSEVTIWKDPVTEMQRTKAHGLLYATCKKDSSKVRQGLADYLIIMGKPGINPAPVGRENGVDRFAFYVGENAPTSDPDEDARWYSIDVWQRYASPVWFDVRQMRTLNHRPAREESDERHICPLQLDVIERAIHLWSNPGDLVLTPFGGIASEPVCAVKMGRRAWGCELKRSYWEVGARNLEEAVAPSPQLGLFDEAAS